MLEPHEVLVTRPPGYVLELGMADLDFQNFVRLRAEADRMLDQGRHEEAAATLREALGLWRGEPLSDLAGEPFADEALPRLDEARLEALEARIEADLAAGRSAELVHELRALVRDNPLRERFRAQLMLALYRAGRQADALDAYADARRALVAELGLEPGPELQRLQQAILAHDATLEAPGRRAAPRRRPLVFAGAVVLALAALAALLAARSDDRRGDEPTSAAPGEGTIVALDAQSGDVRRRVVTGRTPSAIAVRDGVVWVVDADRQTVLRMAESSRVVESFATGGTPTDVAAGAGAVWVANGRPLPDAQYVGPVATSVARLDPATGTERAESQLPRRRGAVSNLVENHLAAVPNAVWAVTPDFAIARIEAATGAITAVSRAVRAGAVAAGPDGVWVLAVDGTVALLDARSGRPLRRIRVPATSVGSLTVGAGAAWVTSPADGVLWRIGGAQGRRPTLGAIQLERGVLDVVAGPHGVWVANPLAGTLVQLDSEDTTIVRTIELGGIPRAIALDGGTLWVALVADPSASSVAVSGVQPFPAATCDRVLTGGGDADLLIVSDLPLKGGARVPTPQMAQAIEFVLRERGFRAGSFRIAYQSCDDSLAWRGLPDDAKCAANARGYAANPDVVGIIGTFNSGCAFAALPELNRAPGGPLALVSPSNSDVGLTRTAPGLDPSLPAALYPTGRRNYVRVHPTDDLQGAALALLARDRGHRRVFVLDDGDRGYGMLWATAFETAAQRLGLTVAGRARWDSRASGYGPLAAQVARSRATAVFVGGLLDSNAGRVVRDLRTELGRSVDLLAASGLTPLPQLFERAGPAALGMYVSLTGIVSERLPDAGAQFVARFRRAQPGAEIAPEAVYAAQAAAVLLDAIGRSDGTRRSVIEELFRTRIRNGLLGSFGFDANGDITESPVTIMRVARGGRSNRISSVDGGVVERVVRPSPRLVATDG